MDIQKSQIQNFLSKLSVIDHKYKVLAESKEDFNIFTTLRKSNDEVQLFSRFISVLLSPKSSHNKKHLFLEEFLKVLNIVNFDTSNCEVYPTEYNKSEFHNIDILIINRKSKQAIIIENKIGAGDSNHEDRGQLEGYFDLIHKQEYIPKEQIKVFYLSPNRRYPSDKSLGKYKTLDNMNGDVIDYEHEIQQWLNQCIKHCINNPYIRESILQFKDLIDSMTNNNTSIEERLAIRDLIASSPENMDSAKLLATNFKHVKWHTAREFWDELKSQLEKNNFTISSVPTDEDITNTTHYEAYKKFYPKNNDYCIGCSFEGINIYIQNGCGDNWLYWGVWTKGLSEEFIDKIEKSANVFNSKNKDSYIEINFDLDEDKKIFFPDFSFTGTFNLINRDYRLGIIKKLVDELKESILKFIK